MSADNTHIGIRIRQFRKKRGLNQRQLCEAVQISENYLSQIENGKYAPSFRLLSKISDYLDMNATADDFPVSIRNELKNLIKEHGIAEIRLGLEKLNKEMIEDSRR